MKIKFLFVAAGALLLAGCHSTQTLKYDYVTTGSAPVQATDQNAQAQLAEAAVSVGHSLQQLSAIQQSVHPQARMPAPQNAGAIGMAQQVSVDWTGPVKPILQRLANTAHYRLNVIGSTPAIPVIVSLNVRNQTVANVVRNIKYQVTQKAAVMTYPRSKLIELRYRSQ